jgi:hypothetical protein
MTQLSTKIKLYANKEIDFRKDVILQDDSDGKGAYIKEWNLDIPKPTQSQLQALETEAIEYERIQGIRSQRANSYPSIQDQLDMLYWDKVNGTDNWLNSISSVKINILSSFPSNKWKWGFKLCRCFGECWTSYSSCKCY